MSDAIWIAIIGGPLAGFVGYLIKFLGDKSVERQGRRLEESKTSEAVKLHEMTELAQVRAQLANDVDSLERDRDRWQRNYYAMRDAFYTLVRRMISVFQSLRFNLAVQRSEEAKALVEQQIAELEKTEPPVPEPERYLEKPI